MVPTERLIDLLWGENPPASAVTTVRSVVSRLRRKLGPDVIGPADGGRGFRMAVGPDDVDAHRLAAAVEAAEEAFRGGDYPLVETLLSAALVLWRGDPLGDLVDAGAAEGERVRLRELHLAAVEQRFDAAVRLGRHQQMIADLEGQVAEHPLRERLWGLLMVALYRSGRQADALTAFQRARTLLIDELGVEPGPELRRLEAAILTHTLEPTADVVEPVRSGGAPVAATGTSPVAVGTTSLLCLDSDGRWPTRPRRDPVQRDRGDQGSDPEDPGTVTMWFETVVEALHAAVRLQRDCPAGNGPPRVGVHATSAGRGDARAASVGRAVMSAAHPGQVLVSAVVVGTSPTMPAGFGLLDLGAHRLGLPGEPPHRLHQLLHPDLRAGFPAPATVDSVPNNLAVPSSVLIDRVVELRDLARSVQQERLVTLVGPGGVGKTRLAVHAAATSIGCFPDGAWFVDLSATDDPAPIINMIAGALNVPLGVTRPPIEELLEHLRDRRLLIVLDNCEHLIEATAPLAVALVGLPEVHLLATSREPLNVDPERVQVVPPLDLDDARRLFGSRAQGAGAPTPADEPVVRDLCRRLDGLPLAIELAAANTTLRTPRDLLTLLSRGELRGRARRDLPARHRTLRTVAEDSYRLLDPTAKALFRRLSVFAKDAAIDTVVQVCGEDLEEPEDLLATLVESSLVVAEPHAGHMRYRLLETLRTYAREWLTENPTERAGVEHRHGQWAAQLAAQADAGLRSPSEREWYEVLDRDFDELRAAYTRAMAQDDIALALAVIAPLQHYAIFRVRPELYSMAAAAADHPRAAGELAARADALAAWGAFAAFDLPAAQAHAERALQRGSSSYTHAVTVSMLALATGIAGDPAGAREHFYRALRRARQDDDPYWIAFLIGFGLSSKAAGVDLGAARYAAEGAQIAHRAGIRSLRAFVAVGQGYTALSSDHAAAADHLRRGVTLAEDAGCIYLARYAHAGLAGLGEPTAAAGDVLDLLTQARRWHETGDHFQAIINLLSLSDRFAALRRHTESHHLRSAIVGLLGKPAGQATEALGAAIAQAAAGIVPADPVGPPHPQ